MSRQEAGRAGERAPRRRRASVAGVLGELLVTAGVLVLLFIGWQNVFNSWYLNGKQDSAAAQLGKQWLEQSPSAAAPAAVGDGETALGPRAAVPVEKTAPAYLGAVGVIYVPRFGSDWKRTIREGTDTPVLNSATAGVGHYINTAMPGAVGNFAVAAHDTGYGNTFLHVQNLRVGDKIYVQTPDGFYTYVFRNYVYVQPNQTQVLEPVPMSSGAQASDRIMTMTTCNPPYHSVERLIAYAVLASFSKAPPAAIAGSVG